MNRTIARRQLLRGLGGIGVGLPFLDALQLGQTKNAQAQGLARPKRLILMTTPGAMDSGRPTGTDTTLDLGSMLAPLQPHVADILALDGLDLEAGTQSTEHRGDGAGHASFGCLFTGNRLRKGGPHDDGDGFAVSVTGRSLDHVLGDAIGQNHKFPSLQLQVGPAPHERWGWMGAHASWLGDNQWAEMEWHPERLYERLFSTLMVDGSSETPENLAIARRIAQRQSVLDLVKEEYSQLSQTVGAQDRARLEQHFEAIRSLETRLSQGSEPNLAPIGAACKKPTPTPDLDWEDEARTPEIASMFLDEIAMAFACNLTPVVTLQWSRCTSRNAFPWLDVASESWYHDWQHAEADADLEKVNHWYAQQLAGLIDRLKSLPEGDGSVFDNTAIVWTTELGDSAAHIERNHCWLVAGNLGGNFRTGRYVKLSRPNSYHNHLLVSLLNAMGVEQSSFGDPDFGVGAMTGLI